jgi:diacylglycerol kinase family enzyme
MVAATVRAGGRDAIGLGVLPIGTANIFARALGIGDPRLALRALEHGRVRRVDVMRTSHAVAPIALVSISGGFEGEFLARYARRRSIGRAVAALAAAPAAWSRRPAVALTLDGESVLRPEEVVFSAGLYTTPFYVGGLVMSPGADIADGRGEAVVYRTARAYGTALVAALRGTTPPAADAVVRRAWRTAHVESQGPLQFDGEPAAGGDVSVWIEPGALAVIVPAGGAA